MRGSQFYTELQCISLAHSLRSLAVMAGMKKPNNHAETTKVER